MTEHTPAPWRIQESDNNRHFITSVEKPIATMRSDNDVFSPNEVNANARLVATAPELLEACKKTVDILTNMTTEQYARGEDKPIRELLVDIIQKATS